jgi:hypothetical protein
MFTSSRQLEGKTIMLSQFWENIISVMLAIAGVALFAVLVSSKSNTAGVLQAFYSGNSNFLDTAISPVTGATTAPNLSYPTAGGGSGFSTFGMDGGTPMFNSMATG